MKIQDIKKEIESKDKCIGCGNLLKGKRGRLSKSGCCHNCVGKILANYNRLSARKVYVLISQAKLTQAIEQTKEEIEFLEELLHHDLGKNINVQNRIKQKQEEIK